MHDTFDAYDYVNFLRERWRTVLVICSVALAAAGLISVILPKQYTATASILIDPPAGADPRTSTAVSSMYLESLKTYEHLATGDSMFLRALDRFHLRSAEDSGSLERRKQRILKVSKLRDTRVLEISATLPDAATAQAFAQYMAEETVKSNQAILRDADSDLIEGATREMEQARARFNDAQAAWGAFNTAQPLDALKNEVDSLVDERASVRRRLIAAREDAAEKIEKAQDRAAYLQTELHNIDENLAAKNRLLAQGTIKRDQLESQLSSAKTSYEAATLRLREVRDTIGYRGDRLKIIDPGIVPTRPSFPNLTVNLFAALLAALVVALVYLSVAFTQQRRRGSLRRNEPLHRER
jgi:uncharacterized protein involved in exopolysaccharide biosynthesis